MRKTFKVKPVKVIPKSLKELVGKKIIRITSTINGDWSFTNEPILLKGFTSNNTMIIKYIKEYSRDFGEKIDELPICFTDNKWILLEDAIKVGDNELNNLIGKKIKRIRPVYIVKYFGKRKFLIDQYKEDRSYMYEYGEIPPILVSASKYHMVVKEYDVSGNENLIIIGPRYSNPKDWEEVKN